MGAAGAIAGPVVGGAISLLGQREAIRRQNQQIAFNNASVNSQIEAIRRQEQVRLQDIEAQRQFLQTNFELDRVARESAAQVALNQVKIDEAQYDFQSRQAQRELGQRYLQSTGELEQATHQARQRRQQGINEADSTKYAATVKHSQDIGNRARLIQELNQALENGDTQTAALIARTSLFTPNRDSRSSNAYRQNLDQTQEALEELVRNNVGTDEIERSTEYATIVKELANLEKEFSDYEINANRALSRTTYDTDSLLQSVADLTNRGQLAFLPQQISLGNAIAGSQSILDNATANYGLDVGRYSTQADSILRQAQTSQNYQRYNTSSGFLSTFAPIAASTIPQIKF